MAIKRITFLQELLGFVGLEGRLHLAWVSSAEAQRFVRIVTEFTEKVRGLGPCPIQTALLPSPEAAHPLLASPTPVPLPIHGGEGWG